MDYPRTTLQRARQAVACSPFRIALFAAMGVQSVSLAEIAGTAGVRGAYVAQVLSERAVERSLLWLIQVGLLRREVDGQGLTDSFRLTPLGRLIVEQWQQQGDRFRQASLRDRLQDFWRRLWHGAL
ncbi:MAG TPA: Npun_F0494 family protein [Stenomitos sp.]